VVPQPLGLLEGGKGLGACDGAHHQPRVLGCLSPMLCGIAGLGKGDGELGAQPHHALGFDVAPVGLDDLLGYGQAQPCSLAVFGAGFFATVEALEDAGQVLRWDARAGVGDGDLDMRSGLLSSLRTLFNDGPGG